MEDDQEEQRSSPAGASVDKMSNSSDKSSDKSYNSLNIDKNCEKAFGSASSSSSSSTISAPLPTRQQPPDLGDVHQEPQKVRLINFLQKFHRSTFDPTRDCRNPSTKTIRNVCSFSNIVTLPQNYDFFVINRFLLCHFHFVISDG